LAIEGRPVNPLQIVTDWINILRWEVSHFWDINSPDNEIVPGATLHVTHEHRIRCGEILGYGISLLLTERRLNIGLQNFFFYESSAARPDFVFNLSQNHRFGTAWNQFRYGLETRWRKSAANIPQMDVVQLHGKKTGHTATALSGVIAVYCYYGEGSHRSNSAVKTRIQLADPAFNEEKMTADQSAEVVILHYHGVCSRLGLWEYQDFLREAVENIRNNEVLRTTWGKRPATTPDSCITRIHKKRKYVGRAFCPTVERIHRNDTPDTGRAFIFWGLNTSVLEMIRKSRWSDLVKFRDANASKLHHPNSSKVTSDGVLKYEAHEPSKRDRALIEKHKL